MPQWQPDSASTKCYLCKIRFNFINRRHHCRKCGQLVCAKCSAKQVRYFNNSYVLNAQNTPEKAQKHTYYRTCDVCADEIEMIRQTIAAAEAPQAGTQEISTCAAETTCLPPPKAVKPAKKPLQRISQTSQSSQSSNANDSDADICPVCGIDLWDQFSAQKMASRADFDPYKETHVSQCLVTYDFNNDNMRLSSPPNGLQARNRMLVYHIPPIPEPSYETIKGSPPDSSGSVSNTTYTGNEKAALDTECVICLDDLRPGDKVGRLECLCVFHYKCIKDWFNKKSFAECPVHFLHS